MHSFPITAASLKPRWVVEKTAQRRANEVEPFRTEFPRFETRSASERKQSTKRSMFQQLSK